MNNPSHNALIKGKYLTCTRCIFNGDQHSSNDIGVSNGSGATNSDKHITKPLLKPPSLESKPEWFIRPLFKTRKDPASKPCLLTKASLPELLLLIIFL